MGKRWLPLAFVITVFAVLAYGTVQQSYRQSANDPQIQMAEDAAAMIAKGVSIQAIAASTSVDIAQSLAPYMVIYDDSGKPIAGNGILNGALPTLPNGILDYMRMHGEDRITWEPEVGVRSAIVIVPIMGRAGFVMVGRSLREVEIREDSLELMTLAAGLFALIGSAIIEGIFSFFA